MFMFDAPVGTCTHAREDTVSFHACPFLAFSLTPAAPTQTHNVKRESILEGIIPTATFSQRRWSLLIFLQPSHWSLLSAALPHKTCLQQTHFFSPRTAALRRKSSDFLERFFGEEFREQHYLSTTLFPVIGCGVTSNLPVVPLNSLPSGQPTALEL